MLATHKLLKNLNLRENRASILGGKFCQRIVDTAVRNNPSRFAKLNSAFTLKLDRFFPHQDPKDQQTPKSVLFGVLVQKLVMKYLFYSRILEKNHFLNRHV